MPDPIKCTTCHCPIEADRFGLRHVGPSAPASAGHRPTSDELCDHDPAGIVERVAHGYLGDAPVGTRQRLCGDCGETLPDLEAWRSGAGGPCPFCGELIAEGDDCHFEHYSRALDAIGRIGDEYAHGSPIHELTGVDELLAQLAAVVVEGRRLAGRDPRVTTAETDAFAGAAYGLAAFDSALHAADTAIATTKAVALHIAAEAARVLIEDHRQTTTPERS